MNVSYLKSLLIIALELVEIQRKTDKNWSRKEGRDIGLYHEANLRRL